MSWSSSSEESSSNGLPSLVMEELQRRGWTVTGGLPSPVVVDRFPMSVVPCKDGRSVFPDFSSSTLFASDRPRAIRWRRNDEFHSCPLLAGMWHSPDLCILPSVKGSGPCAGERVKLRLKIPAIARSCSYKLGKLKQTGDPASILTKHDYQAEFGLLGLAERFWERETDMRRVVQPPQMLMPVGDSHDTNIGTRNWTAVICRTSASCRYEGRE